MRFRRLGVAVCVASVLAGASAATSQGAPISACTERGGTIVAVDFARWGGPIARGCAVGQTTASAALRAAGFETSGDDHDGPAFVCRLGDAAFRHGTQYPTPAQDGCIDTPPASGYWSFWSAPAGAPRFRYSELGAEESTPRAGEVELWTFGATDIAGTRGSGVPRFDPRLLRASWHAHSLGTGGPAIVDALATSGTSSSGSPAGLIAGIAVALILAGGAAWTVRRRGRSV